MAVILVVAYHFAPGLLPGGFVGVDIFFVLSGFLITTILLRERSQTGGTDLRRFWLHRARRLLPALGAVVVVCVAAVAVAVASLQIRGEPVGGSLWGDLLVGVGIQIAAGATFTSNWLSVAAGQSYAASGSPDLFANLWSLAVEEQFYLLWPLVIVALLVAGVAMRRAAYGAAAAAVASAVAMALLVPTDGDPTRVYVGTDTHAFGLMIGAALAFWWRHREDRPGLTERADQGRALAGTIALGGAGLVALAAVSAWMHWDSPWTYRGGLLLASLATAAVIHATLALPALGRALDVAPLRWIGERSYGIYLWHWPVLVILVTALDGGRIRSASALTVALAAIVTVAGAAASYRWLEIPVRRLGFRQALRGLVDWLYPETDTHEVARVARRRRAGLFGGTVAAVLALAGSAVAAAPEKTSLELQLEEGARIVAEVTPEAASPTSPAPAASGPTGPSAAASPTPAPAEAQAAAPAPEPSAAAVEVPVPAGRHVVVLGDSVTVGAAGALKEALPGIVVKASVGKQFIAGVDDVLDMVDRDVLRPYVVVALGTNGTVRAEDLDTLVAAAGDHPVVLVTPYGDRSWIPGAQRTLRAAAKRYDNVVIADWQAVVEADTSILGPDGIHPRAVGVDAFVEVIERGLVAAAGLEAAR